MLRFEILKSHNSYKNCIKTRNTLFIDIYNCVKGKLPDYLDNCIFASCWMRLCPRFHLHLPETSTASEVPVKVCLVGLENTRNEKPTDRETDRQNTWKLLIDTTNRHLIFFIGSIVNVKPQLCRYIKFHLSPQTSKNNHSQSGRAYDNTVFLTVTL